MLRVLLFPICIVRWINMVGDDVLVVSQEIYRDVAASPLRRHFPMPARRSVKTGQAQQRRMQNSYLTLALFALLLGGIKLVPGNILKRHLVHSQTT